MKLSNRNRTLAFAGATAQGGRLRISARLLAMVGLLLVAAIGVHYGVIPVSTVPLFPFAGMAFPADAIDVVDLRALTDGGFVREDLYRQVFFLQTVADTPFTNLVGTDFANSDKHEWTFDDVRVASTANARIAGADPANPRVPTGSRVINRAQISDGYIAVSTTARVSATMGNGDQLAYETHKELMGIRQDVEAIALSRQASVIGDNNATAQKTASFSAWLKTNSSFGAGGASPGYNNATHVVDAPTNGTSRALAWSTLVSPQLLAVYNKRGNVQYAMSIPQLIQGLNTSIVNGTIKVATPQATLSANNPPAAQTGQGWFSGVISDFGFQITFVPNRIQPTYVGVAAVVCCELFLFDPDRYAMCYLQGYNIVDLGKKSALRDERHIAVQWLTKPFREDAHAVIRDINGALAVTA